MKRLPNCVVASFTVLLGAGISGTPAAESESNYPQRPVRMIVPFPPGGANDIVARLVAHRLNERWGRPVVVDNRGGAGGNIGTELGVKAAPDGYTLLVGSVSTLASNVGLYPKLPFDPRRDLAPITLIATVPSILVVNLSVAAASVQELIQLAKATPKRLNFSSFGDGSSAHLMGEMFKSMAKIDIVHVPYKGGGPALVAVVTGEVQMTFSNLSVALPQVKAGKVKGIAVTSAQRAMALPETPTIAESGLADFEASTWVGIVAPVSTPRALIQRINRDIHSVIAEPEMKNQLLSRALEPAASTPEAFARQIHTDIERWSKIIREVGVRAE